MSMSLYLERARKAIEEHRHELLEQYCIETGADMGKVIYTLEGWDEFENWIIRKLRNADQEPKKGAKAWCWWKSRSLYYTGRIINNKYEFRDDIGAITMVSKEELLKLKF